MTDSDASSLVLRTASKVILAKTPMQQTYVDAIRSNEIVFGLGPAGTGKTYLAMAMAARALLDKKVKRIVLTRPAVEAGEKLGFLPGDLSEKISPYLRPLFDALREMMDEEKCAKLIERKIVEVAPLAFMRGRTLNDSFIIMDEAQNATHEQMKMLLTRMGYGSQIVITGDVTQTDLPKLHQGGLARAVRVLGRVPGIQVVEFDATDVVRHPLVGAIINAYDADDGLATPELPAYTPPTFKTPSSPVFKAVAPSTPPEAYKEAPRRTRKSKGK